MKFHKLWKLLLPKTLLGKYSVRLMIGFFIFMVIFFTNIAIGFRGGDTFFSQPWLAVPISFAFLCAGLSFLTGITSVFKDKERAILVFLAIIIGFLVSLFLVLELSFPH